MPHYLSDDLGATIDENTSGIIIYDTRAYSPQKILALSAVEMNALIDLYLDGCCAYCFCDIASGDILCEDCFENACVQRASTIKAKGQNQ